MFDWPIFLDHHGIEYITSGHNVTAYNVGVPCPFCGDDPSFHMGISLNGKGWHCWRIESHAGKSPARLVSALLGISFEQAIDIVQAADTGTFVTSDETFSEDCLRRLGVNRNQPVSAPSAGKLKFLDEFQPISNSGRCRMLVFPYMQNRGYDPEDALWLAERYHLRFAFSGPFAYRIIVPVYMRGELVNWTGRSVATSEEMRYKSLSTDPEKAARERLPTAPLNIKHTLLDYDNLRRGGRVLVLSEGPFDAMRLGFFGERYGIKSSCVFSKSLHPSQLDLLVDILDKFDERILLFDGDAWLSTFSTLPDYLVSRFEMKRMPRDKDPAELTFSEFRRLFGV